MSFTFDATEVDTSSVENSGYLIPKGTYELMISEITDKENSKGTGRYLSITLQVVGGPFDSKKVFENINYQHSNETAEKIGRAKLANLIESALGSKQKINGTDCLLNRIVMASVIQKVRTDNLELKNEVEKYIKRDAVRVEPIKNQSDVPF